MKNRNVPIAAPCGLAVEDLQRPVARVIQQFAPGEPPRDPLVARAWRTVVGRVVDPMDGLDSLDLLQAADCRRPPVDA